MANDQSKLEVTLSLIDKATAPLTAFNKRVADITKPIRDVNNRLMVLGRESGIGKISDAFKGVGEAAGGVAEQVRALGETALKVGAGIGVIGGALFGLVKMTADFGDRTDELSNKAGVSARAFQEMAYAAKFSSIDAETLATTLAKMNKNIVAAVTGNKEMAVWFKRAGLSISDLKKLKPDEVFDRVLAKIDLFNKAGNSMKANGLATGILGKGGADLIPAADGFDELRKKAEQLGIVMSDDAVKASAAFNDKFDETATVIKGVGFMIGGILMPHVQKIVEIIEEWTLKNRDLIASKVTEWLGKFNDALPEIIKNVKELFGYFKGKAEFLMTVVDAVGGVTNALKIFAAIKLLPLVASIATLAKAFGLLNLAVLTSPITYIVLGIIAVIAALVVTGFWFYKNWDLIAKGFGDVWQSASKVVSDELNGIADSFSNAWTQLIAESKKAWTELKDFFSGLWDGIKTMFDDGVKYITDKLASINPVNAIGSAWDWTKGLFGGGATPAPSQGVGSTAGMLGAPVGVGPLAAQSGGGAQSQGVTNTNNAKVSVDFTNVPKGVDVKPDVGNKAPLDLSMGYAMTTM